MFVRSRKPLLGRFLVQTGIGFGPVHGETLFLVIALSFASVKSQIGLNVALAVTYMRALVARS